MLANQTQGLFTIIAPDRIVAHRVSRQTALEIADVTDELLDTMPEPAHWRSTWVSAVAAELQQTDFDLSEQSDDLARLRAEVVKAAEAQSSLQQTVNELIKLNESREADENLQREVTRLAEVLADDQGITPDQAMKQFGRMIVAAARRELK